MAGVLTLGIGAAPQLEYFTDFKFVRHGIVATVLFLMALPLEATSLWGTMRRPRAPLLASAINFGLLPLVAWAAASLLGDEMRLGLYVAASTPSTLASASVWTRRAGGNDAIAIVVTVLTNLSCFLLTPMWLYFYTGQDVKTESLEFANMIVKLGVLVVLPMSLAQLLRRIWPKLADWATANKTPLGVLAQWGVLTMILLGSVQTGIRLREPDSQGILSNVVPMMLVVMGIHLTMLWAGLKLSDLAGLGRADRIAVALSGSQKTLMVGLQVGMELGFSILPIVTYHVGQLLADTMIADQYRARTSQLESAPDAPTAPVS
ncbi:MAG: bile acid:sodium symporter [Planctomycetales bacterium]|nr:bile acid:sodium symporter [Planctomycetales bacterium]